MTTPTSTRKRTSTHRSPARFVARMLRGARPGQFPGFIAPCNPTLTSVVPAGERWLYEIKHDGYRMQAHLVEGKSALLTSSGLDWTGRFRSLVAPLTGGADEHMVKGSDDTVSNRPMKCMGQGRERISRKRRGSTPAAPWTPGTGRRWSRRSSSSNRPSSSGGS